MKSLVAVGMLLLALSLCNLIGRRGNSNSNDHASPTPTPEFEASPTLIEPPPPAPPSPSATATARTSNKNTNTQPPTVIVPPVIVPPTSVPGVPRSSMPGTNTNSAASVPRPPSIVSGGVLNGKAIRLVQPSYPAIARAAHVSGRVTVQVLVDENGNVVSASAVSGHPLLQGSAVAAARASKFSPTMLSGQPVKVSGVIIYNFVEK